MSNYEKYYYSQQADTFKPAQSVKTNTDNDDLYLATKDDSLKQLQKQIRAERKALRKQQQLKEYSYTDSIDYYNDSFFYTSMINRFYRPFSYSFYYSNFWRYPYWGYDPFFYDSWIYDPFYYGYDYWEWEYPYWGYPYWGYNNWHGYGFSPVRHSWGSINHNLYTSQKRPIIKPQPQNRSAAATLNNNSIRRNNNTYNTQSRPVYNQNRRNRYYSPTYSSPRMGTRPMYNNTRSYNSNRVQSRTYFSPSFSRSYSTTSRSYSGGGRSYSGGGYSGGGRRR